MSTKNDSSIAWLALYIPRNILLEALAIAKADYMNNIKKTCAPCSHGKKMGAEQGYMLLEKKSAV